MANALEKGVERRLHVSRVLLEVDRFGRDFSKLSPRDLPREFLTELPRVNRVVVVGKDQRWHANAAPLRTVGARRVSDNGLQLARRLLGMGAVKLFRE